MEVRELLAPTAREAVPHSKAGPGEEAKKTGDLSPFSSLFANIMQNNIPLCTEDECSQETAEISRLVFAPALAAGFNLMALAGCELSGDQPGSEGGEALTGTVGMPVNGDAWIARGQTDTETQTLELLDVSLRRDLNGETVPDGNTETIAAAEREGVPVMAPRQKDPPPEIQDGIAEKGGNSTEQSKRVFEGGIKTAEEAVENFPEGKSGYTAASVEFQGKNRTVHHESLSRPSGKGDRAGGASKTEAKAKVSIEFSPADRPEAEKAACDMVKVKAVQRDVVDAEKPDFAAKVVERIKVMVNAKRSEVSVQLKPESLGRMSFKLEVVNGVLNGRITVQNSQAREVLQANLSQLRDSLEQSGIPVSKLTVNIGSSGEFRHHQFNQGNGHTSNSFTGRWALGGYREEEAEEGYRWNRLGTVEFLA